MYSSGSVAPPGGEAAPPDESAVPKSGEGDKETVDEDSMMGNSAIIPNKVLTGPDGTSPKEGDEIVLKVVKNFGDESEVVYAPAEKHEKGMHEGGMMSDANTEIEAMDEKG